MKSTLTTMLFTPVLVLAAGHAAPAFALDCNNAMSTMDINECASIEKDKTEKKLNQVYQRVIASLSKRDEDLAENTKVKNALVAAQREWVKFREADCNAVFTKYEDGTIRTVMFIGCMQNHAQQRIKDLEEFERE